MTRFLHLLICALPLVLMSSLAAPSGAVASEFDAPAGMLAGSVVAHDGAPVPNARLAQVPALVPRPGTPELREVVENLEEFESEADGSFLIPARVLGSGLLLVTAPGHGSGKAPFWGVRADESGFDVGPIRLPPPALPVRGRVLDAAGEPLAGIEVRASSSEPYSVLLPGRGAGERVAITDGAGDFQFDDLEGATVILSANDTGFVPATVLVSGMTAEARTVEMVLTGVAMLTGVVLDGAGNPVPDAVVLSNPSASVPAFVATATDRDGRFELANARPGTISLVAEAPGHARSQTVTVTVEPGAREENVVLRLAPPVSFAGRLLDESGEPIAGTRVRDQSATQEVETDADGRFRIGLLREGLHDLEVWLENRPPFTLLVDVSPHDAASVNNVRPILGRLEGRILHSDGSAAGSLLVVAEALGPGPGPPGHRRAYGRTESDGTFAFDRMPTGPYRLRLSLPAVTSRGGDGWSVPELVELAASPLDMVPVAARTEVRLPEPTRVRFRLTGAAPPLTSEEVEQSVVLLVSADTGERIEMQLGEPRADGTFAPVDLLPGWWAALVMVIPRELGANEGFLVEAGAGETVIELELRTRQELGM